MLKGDELLDSVPSMDMLFVVLCLGESAIMNVYIIVPAGLRKAAKVG